MHEEPQVPNYGEPGTGVLLEEGMVLAVEPMVTAGRHTVRVGEDHWAIYSQDGSLAAHFEFTIAITADGPRVLTPWNEAGRPRGGLTRRRRRGDVRGATAIVPGGRRRVAAIAVRPKRESCCAALLRHGSGGHNGRQSRARDSKNQRDESEAT